MLKKINKFKEKQQISIQWFIILNILATAIILIIGGIKIKQDIESVHNLSRENFIQSQKATSKMSNLVNQQLPVRASVAKQKILVERFAYEFQLFVAMEDGQIGALKKTLSQMCENYKHLEAIWMKVLPETKLHELKANINMAIGVYEEAEEYELIGFGEMYRLGEDSKMAVHNLTAVMDDVEVLLNEVSNASVDNAFEESAITLNNERVLLELLLSVSQQNVYTLIFVFVFVIVFQIVFTLFYKRKLSYFYEMTKFISKKGDLSKRINLKSKDEFGYLAVSFNKMLDKLQKVTDSKIFLNSIIDSMNEMVFVLSSEGTIKSVNTTATFYLLS